MKRFVNIGHQIGESDNTQFAFFCTVKNKFECFSGVQVWDSIKEFTTDYHDNGGNDIERYLRLIPEYNFNYQKYEHLIKMEFDKIAKIYAGTNDSMNMDYKNFRNFIINQVDKNSFFTSLHYNKTYKGEDIGKIGDKISFED